jgi:molybdopterin converting factor small subunit
VTVTDLMLSGATVADALEALRDADDLGKLLGRMPIRAAVNREYVSAERPLASGDELALIPPVSGGAAPARGGSDMHAGHRKAPLPGGVAKVVGRPEAGAIVTFRRMTREVDLLEYEAYRGDGDSGCRLRHGLRLWFQGVRRGGDPPLTPGGVRAGANPYPALGPTG